MTTSASKNLPRSEDCVNGTHSRPSDALWAHNQKEYWAGHKAHALLTVELGCKTGLLSHKQLGELSDRLE